MRLAVAIPCYSPGTVNALSLLHIQACAKVERIGPRMPTGSLLALSHNLGWFWAVNNRERFGFTHLLMMHSDVEPIGTDWFDRLAAQMEVSGAEAISAIIPIKDHRGLTSTALDTNPWRPYRITQKQAQELPLTWTCGNLLINTGLLLVDLSKPWVEKICFTINDRVTRDDATGEFIPEVQSEDWDFSRQLWRMGVPYFATRAVRVLHHGWQNWDSEATWGRAVDTDVAETMPLREVLITAADGEQRMFDPRKGMVNA